MFNTTLSNNSPHRFCCSPEYTSIQNNFYGAVCSNYFLFLSVFKICLFIPLFLQVIQHVVPIVKLFLVHVCVQRMLFTMNVEDVPQIITDLYAMPMASLFCYVLLLF